MPEKDIIKKTTELAARLNKITTEKNRLKNIYTMLNGRNAITGNPSMLSPALGNKTLTRMRFVSNPFRWTNSAATVAAEKQRKAALKKLAKKITALNQEIRVINQEISLLENKRREK